MKYLVKSFLLLSLAAQYSLVARDLRNDFSVWKSREKSRVTQDQDYYEPFAPEVEQQEILENQTRELRELLSLDDNEYEEITGPAILTAEPYRSLVPQDMQDDLQHQLLTESMRSSSPDELGAIARNFEENLQKEFNLSWQGDRDYEIWLADLDSYFQFVDNPDRDVYRALRDDFDESVRNAAVLHCAKLIQVNRRMLDILKKHEIALKEHVRQLCFKKSYTLR